MLKFFQNKISVVMIHTCISGCFLFIIFSKWLLSRKGWILRRFFWCIWRSQANTVFNFPPLRFAAIVCVTSVTLCSDTHRLHHLLTATFHLSHDKKRPADWQDDTRSLGFKTKCKSAY